MSDILCTFALRNNKDMVKRLSMDRKWQAEEDARTMARYQEIMSDSKRKTAAMNQARVEASNLQKRANAMKLASGGKLKK